MKPAFLLRLAVGAMVALPLAGLSPKLSAQVESVESNGPSLDASISGDGQVVAFTSYASDLASNDTNGTWDVFVRDLTAGETRQASVSSSGEGGDAASMAPSISQDGRYVAFHSRADNLVDGDTNGKWDVFVHDLQTGETERVSLTGIGGQRSVSSLEPSISGDGRYIAYESWNSVGSFSTTSILVYDRLNGTTTVASVDDIGHPLTRPCYAPSVSADGSAVAFFCQGTVSLQSWYQAFVYDMARGVTTMVSVSGDGTPANTGANVSPSISADGSLVSFGSTATNLVPGGDTNSFKPDIIVRDRTGAQTEVASVTSGGAQPAGGSFTSSISGDGRYVAFHSKSPELAPGDGNGTWDIFLHDRQTGDTELISVNGSADAGDAASIRPSVNSDGRYVAFSSKATDLTADADSNGTWDVFVRDMQTGQTTLVSVPGS